MAVTPSGKDDVAVGGEPRNSSRGKGRILSANISQQSRSLLEAEAQRTGSSVSQVVDRWIKAAGEGQATWEERLGPDVRLQAATLTLVEIAYAIKKAVPNERQAYFVTAAAWAAAASSALGPIPPSADVVLRMTNEATLEAQIAQLKVLIARFSKRYVKVGNNKLDQAARDLEEFANSVQGSDVNSTLQALRKLKGIDKNLDVFLGPMLAQLTTLSNAEKALAAADKTGDEMAAEVAKKIALKIVAEMTDASL